MTLERALEIVETNDMCNKQLDIGLCKNKDCEDCSYNLAPKEFNEAVHVLYGAVKADISKHPQGPAIKMTLLSGGDEDVR